MSVSLAVKAGSAGALATGGGLAGTYFAWDHITLYEVEREVINKDLKLDVGDPSGTGLEKKITISAPSHTANPPSGDEIKLLKDYSWSCEIKPESTGTEASLDSNLVTKIKKHFQENDKSLTEKQKENKKLLVKVCSKYREGKLSSQEVKGVLKVKKEGATGQEKLVFVKDKELNFILV